MAELKRLMRSEKRQMSLGLLERPQSYCTRQLTWPRKHKLSQFSTKQQLNNCRLYSQASPTAVRSKEGFFFIQRFLVSCIRSVKQMISKRRLELEPEESGEPTIRDNRHQRKGSKLVIRNYFPLLCLRVLRVNQLVRRTNKL